MKYVYVKAKKTLDVARHLLEHSDEGACIKVKETIGSVLTWRFVFIEELPVDFEIISYQEYRAIVNGKIQAQREILDQEYSRYQKAYYEAEKELKAKELPMDEVTE